MSLNRSLFDSISIPFLATRGLLTQGLLVALAVVYLVLPFDAKADVSVDCEDNKYTFTEPITDSQRESSKNLVSQLCKDPEKTYFKITGTIKRGDKNNLDILTENRWFYQTIRLDSTGGNVSEAMEIGRFVTKNRLYTLVSGDCFSACVFVLMAGKVKGFISTMRAWGDDLRTNKLGIHRPMMTEFDPFGDESIEKAQKRIEKTIRDYMNEMGVDPTLYDLMRIVPPHELKLLTSIEAEDFGLSGANQNIYDEEVAIMAYQADADLGTAWEIQNRFKQCQWEKMASGNHDRDYQKTCGRTDLMTIGFSKKESINKAQIYDSIVQEKCLPILWQKGCCGLREQTAAANSKEFSDCLRAIAIDFKRTHGLTQ